jgi:hypothetical integral membrane protein (TIGR02206 family)
MFDVFLIDNNNFANYGLEHLTCFILTLGCIGWVLYLGKYRWNPEQKFRYFFYISILGAGTQLFKVFYRWNIGTFDITQDLPLHLCNLMTLFMPFVMYFRWQKAWGIIFFWIMAGCAQSIFTPTLTESLPNYEAIRYWAVHGVIILGALYGWYVLTWKITWKDAIRSAVGLNILAAILYPINVMLGSNYMYLNGKPPGKTFYDLLAPWPHYIISLEMIVWLIFGLMLIPFYWDVLNGHLSKFSTKNITKT